MWSQTVESTSGKDGELQFEYKLVKVFQEIKKWYKDSSLDSADTALEQFLSGVFNQNPKMRELISIISFNDVADFYRSVAKKKKNFIETSKKSRKNFKHQPPKYIKALLKGLKNP